MKIKIQQFLFGANHSWAHVGKEIGRSLLQMGHEVHFVSTDGFNEKYCPEDLRPHVRNHPEGQYDCQVSYTAPHNWGLYLAHGRKNRFAIWNYEYNSKTFKDISQKQLLLTGFAKNCNSVDLVLPSSNFSKEVFLNMGIPEKKQMVIPHGINVQDFETKTKYQIKTNKSKKILLNIAQPHKRKALDLALESYGKAFTKDDDVCLVAKIFVSNSKNSQFDVDFFKLLKNYKAKFKNSAEILVLQEYIPNIAELYNACDINFSATHCECFHLPSSEALVSGLINVVPNYGGQLDFCNETNSLLINGRTERAPRDSQYWNYNPFAVHFKIDTDDAAAKLKLAVNNFDELKEKFSSNMKSNILTWNDVSSKIIGLCI